MNKVEIVGTLTADPKTNEAKTVTTITVAARRKFVKEGEKDADFITCKAFNKPGEFVAKYFKKGMKIGISGRIQTGDYEKDGVKHYTTDVIIEEAEFVERKAAETTNDGFVEVPDDAISDLPFK